MRNCPNEGTLERLFVGERSAAQERHVAACPECALRMRKIEQDLERIREALFEDPPLALLRRRSLVRRARPLLGALGLGAAAAGLAAVLWVHPVPVESLEKPSELPGLVSQLLFPAISGDSGALANPRALQLAGLGAALAGGNPCTLEDVLDTNSCDAQDVTTLAAEGW